MSSTRSSARALPAIATNVTKPAAPQKRGPGETERLPSSAVAASEPVPAAAQPAAWRRQRGETRTQAMGEASRRPRKEVRREFERISKGRAAEEPDRREFPA